MRKIFTMLIFSAILLVSLGCTKLGAFEGDVDFNVRSTARHGFMPPVHNHLSIVTDMDRLTEISNSFFIRTENRLTPEPHYDFPMQEITCDITPEWFEEKSLVVFLTTGFGFSIEGLNVTNYVLYIEISDISNNWSESFGRLWYLIEIERHKISQIDHIQIIYHDLMPATYDELLIEVDRDFVLDNLIYGTSQGRFDFNIPYEVFGDQLVLLRTFAIVTDAGELIGGWVIMSILNPSREQAEHLNQLVLTIDGVNRSQIPRSVPLVFWSYF